MTRISYAQNSEDVILARALADIVEGFYVDVGAQDPLVDSVTRMFYERGWKGINIEPVPHWFERLQEDRPRDINLMCAVATTEGSLTLHESSDSGLSTASEEYARNHAAAGRNMVERSVPTRRLDGILAQHAPEIVHFLKIDVEGMEREVLASLSLSRFRPWILVIEATRPNTMIDVSEAWEASVLEAGYRLVYRDGLNRFYLAEEQLTRLSAFQLPPNVFDDFIPYREHASNEYARSLEQRLGVLHDQAEGFRRDLLTVADTAHALQQRTGELEGVLQERQSLLEEAARTTEKYRVDLSVVAEAVENRRQRIAELEKALQERQSLLEETARTAEKYRVDLSVVAEAAENRHQRIAELEQANRLAHQQTALAQGENLKAQRENQETRREFHLVAQAAENRRVLIDDLETRLGRSDDELRQLHHALGLTSTRIDSLQKQLDAIYASRSWRSTAPLRALTGSVRRMIGRIVRKTAATPILRKIGGRMLKGGMRERALHWAGLTVQVDDRAFDSQLSDGAAMPHGQVPLTRAGARVYGLLSLANGRDEDRQ